jgi:hypothetical protein
MRLRFETVNFSWCNPKAAQSDFGEIAVHCLTVSLSQGRSASRFVAAILAFK